jgi:gamma-glutamylcyclotransferase
MRKTIYFGYGSNLWLDQMSHRCPHSKYLGVGRLQNYRWQINERGYANVVEIKGSETSEDYSHEVYGMIYSLTPTDERNLDVNEDVPHAYTKEILSIDFWAAGSSDTPVDVKTKPEKRDMLVYINRKQTKDSDPMAEYIVRMNHGIDDALACGVPKKYVEEVMRKSIPEMDESMVPQSVKDKARKQAMDFNDDLES